MHENQIVEQPPVNEHSAASHENQIVEQPPVNEHSAASKVVVSDNHKRHHRKLWVDALLIILVALVLGAAWFVGKH